MELGLQRIQAINFDLDLVDFVRRISDRCEPSPAHGGRDVEGRLSVQIANGALPDHHVGKVVESGIVAYLRNIARKRIEAEHLAVVPSQPSTKDREKANVGPDIINAHPRLNDFLECLLHLRFGRPRQVSRAPGLNFSPLLALSDDTVLFAQMLRSPVDNSLEQGLRHCNLAMNLIHERGNRFAKDVRKLIGSLSGSSPLQATDASSNFNVGLECFGRWSGGYGSCFRC